MIQNPRHIERVNKIQETPIFNTDGFIGARKLTRWSGTVMSHNSIMSSFHEVRSSPRLAVTPGLAGGNDANVYDDEGNKKWDKCYQDGRFGSAFVFLLMKIIVMVLVLLMLKVMMIGDGDGALDDDWEFQFEWCGWCNCVGTVNGYGWRSMVVQLFQRMLSSTGWHDEACSSTWCSLSLTFVISSWW